MSTLMSFELDGAFLQFEAGGDYPASRPVNFLQVKDRTAAGTSRVETLGITLQSRILVFTLMPLADYNAMLNWFLNISDGAANTFIFTDERGFSGEVRFMDDIFDLIETSFERYAGSITLEYT